MCHTRSRPPDQPIRKEMHAHQRCDIINVFLINFVLDIHVYILLIFQLFADLVLPAGCLQVILLLVSHQERRVSHKFDNFIANTIIANTRMDKCYQSPGMAECAGARSIIPDCHAQHVCKMRTPDIYRH